MGRLDAIRRRHTTNGPLLPDPVSEEHQRLLMEVAGRAPSQLNSQPWRFVIVERRRSGMLFDKLPAPLRPFTNQVFTPRGQRLMNTLRVPQTLGAENRKLVAGAPLLLAVLPGRSEDPPGELSPFYSVFSMGAP